MILLLPAFIFIFQILSVFGAKECQDSGKCRQHLGSKGRCHNKLCGCVDHYYLSQWDESNSNGSCTQCPGIGESCAATQCCNARYLDCQNNICVCFNSEYCWDAEDAQHIHLERIAQCVLGAALILTGVILLVLFLRTCSRRRDVQESLSRDRFPSLNSIQRFALMQMQDRPPPYGYDCVHWKYGSNITEPPPTYIEAIGLSGQSGEENMVFVLGEDAFRRLSENSLLLSMSTGSPEPSREGSPQRSGTLEMSLLPPMGSITLPSASQNLVARSTPSGESAFFQWELPPRALVAESASLSRDAETESHELVAESGRDELSRFQESEALPDTSGHTQNNSDPVITPTFHQCESPPLVTTNVEIHM